MVHDRLTSVLGSIGKMQIFISGRDVIWPSWPGSSGKSQFVDINEMFNWKWESPWQMFKFLHKNSQTLWLHAPLWDKFAVTMYFRPLWDLLSPFHCDNLPPSITFCHYSLLTSCHLWDLLSLFVGTWKILWRLCSAEWCVFLLKFSVHISRLVCNLSINNSVIVYEVLTRELLNDVTSVDGWANLDYSNDKVVTIVCDRSLVCVSVTRYNIYKFSVRWVWERFLFNNIEVICMIQ